MMDENSVTVTMIVKAIRQGDYFIPYISIDASNATPGAKGHLCEGCAVLIEDGDEQRAEKQALFVGRHLVMTTLLNRLEEPLPPFLAVMDSK